LCINAFAAFDNGVVCAIRRVLHGVPFLVILVFFWNFNRLKTYLFSRSFPS